MGSTYTIGLLSGTSADAIDAAIVEWDSVDKPLIACTHSPQIPEKIRNLVFELAISSDHEIEKIRYLDQEFARLFSRAVIELCQKAKINTSDILAIGSHGQTIRHYPPATNTTSEQLGFSLQIGDPNLIAELTQITTVADFRRKDIAVGGHGAPLAPGFHNVVFRSAQTNRIILNTGGIANITLLPASQQQDVIGFDTGPANGLMDSWCQKHKQWQYDKNGEWASKGEVQPSLLDALLHEPYFSLPAPKSTGRETFNLPWLEQHLINLGEDFAPADIQATLLALSVESIAREIEKVTNAHECEIYICGGGAHNTYFCHRLRERLKPKLLDTTEKLGIHPDWVEAACFAWLGKRALEGKSGNLPSVTGASKKVVLGGIYTK